MNRTFSGPLHPIQMRQTSRRTPRKTCPAEWDLPAGRRYWAGAARSHFWSQRDSSNDSNAVTSIAIHRPLLRLREPMSARYDVLAGSLISWLGFRTLISLLDGHWQRTLFLIICSDPGLAQRALAVAPKKHRELLDFTTL